MKWFAVIFGTASFSVLAILSMFKIGTPEVDLSDMVANNLSEGGAENPVTVVLLNFRGYDTLLETGVLLLAVLGILAVGGQGIRSIGRPGDPVIELITRLAIPFMILTSVYLLWAGSSRPGGAFQAAAVLAGGAVLLHLAGLLPGWQKPGRLHRWGIVAGFLLFLVIAGLLMYEGQMLRYPKGHAGSLMMIIESALTVSLGIILAGLFLFISKNEEGGL